MSTDETVLAELGKRVERARLELNLSQERLAAQAGIGKATLERLEAGLPSKLPTLIRVLRALDLIDGLDGLLPSYTGPSPVELAKHGRPRRRATPTRAGPPPGSSPPPGRRPWGDER